MNSQHSPSSEFDSIAGVYDDLLRDPLRDRFAGPGQFFHLRKWLLLREFLLRRGIDPRSRRLLDAGCGRGEFLRLAAGDFAAVAGCDPSREMLKHSAGLNLTLQGDALRIPFDDQSFDVATVICVLHHVAPADRASLLGEVRRVLRPGGLACVFEHNPYNPGTRIIVGRTPVDRDARLLTAASARDLLAGAGFRVIESRYYLYLPAPLYRRAPALERWLGWLPLGGQYAVLAEAPA
ncbi:MAG: class I SAM-dependent methyltransferase [Acidobacteria bacterium]|nr:class I SAM-dependent methyltransferase [Acidobacteriota bacterium]